MSTRTDTDYIDNLFLELSQFTKATTAKELALKTALTAAEARCRELEGALQSADNELVFWMEHNRDCDEPMIGPGRSILKTRKQIREILEKKGCAG
jgi:hypothetical protein